MPIRPHVVEYLLLSSSTWLVQHGFDLNNREWASLLWVGIAALWLVPRAQMGDSLWKLIRSALAPKLLVVWLSFIAWVALAVLLAKWLHIWEAWLTKDTLIWATTAGLVSLAGFTDAHEPGFLPRAVLKVAGVSVWMEYLVNLSAFSLLVEMLLQPLIFVFVAAPMVVKTNEERQKWQRWSNYFFLVVGIALLVNTGVFLSSIWGTISWRSFVLRASWPVMLGIWVLVLVLAWGLVSSYERAFMRLESARADQRGAWKAKIGLVLGLGVNLKWIHHAARGGTYWIAKAESVRTAVKATRAFKTNRKAEERSEEVYQANLKRFAGNPGFDEQGRRVDKREFRETRNVLDWLHTCHMGWYRHEPIGYKNDLFDRFGDDFTDRGLPSPSGIVMNVAADGTKWYAWRRTVGGHFFAIGARGEPPNRWQYDGRTPPSGFPGIAPEWGNMPFDENAAPNWNE